MEFLHTGNLISDAWGALPEGWGGQWGVEHYPKKFMHEFTSALMDLDRYLEL